VGGMPKNDAWDLSKVDLRRWGAIGTGLTQVSGFLLDAGAIDSKR
jgi:hypothetical protein